ncbi:MAG: hypothetical protein QXQ28_07475 [Candidatus Nezhaarchaeales archaeon]
MVRTIILFDGIEHDHLTFYGEKLNLIEEILGTSCSSVGVVFS